MTLVPSVKQLSIVCYLLLVYCINYVFLKLFVSTASAKTRTAFTSMYTQKLIEKSNSSP